jgi:GMP synthase-like glutamine amidotransferase
VRILALVHQPDAPPGTYADLVRGAGAELAVWDVSVAAEPPSPPEAFDGVIVLGGSAHPDQEDVHPWILAELCLGAQLLARVLGAPVGPTAEEVGFTEVGLTDEGSADPLLGGLPPRFEAFQWHRYGFGLPAGAVALARNKAGLQAFRHGDRAWAVQFHPEVDEEIATAWAASEGTEAPAGDYAAWGDAGARICRGFLDVCGMRL